MDSKIIESYQYATKTRSLGKQRAFSNFPLRKSAEPFKSNKAKYIIKNFKFIS